MTHWFNRWPIPGAAVGIEVRGADLRVALVKARWSGVRVVAKTTLQDFRRRPPAEWGQQYQAFVRTHGFQDQAATLALPRGEVIVRLLSLPAAARAELASAVRYQVDSLHPYGEENVYYGFASLPARGAVNAAVVIAPRLVVDRYADLFAEAGLELRGCTVAAAGYHAAMRVAGRPPGAFLLVDRQDSTCELYGESPARAFFSAVCAAGPGSLEKAVAGAAAEMRLAEEESSPATPRAVLGPVEAGEDFDLDRDATVYAVAVAAAFPRRAWRLNLLPAARRSTRSRWPMAVTAASATAAAVVALGLWLRGPIQDRRYVRALEREAARLEAVEREVRTIERQARRARDRRAQIESFRRRTEIDAALVTEISRRLPVTVWLNQIEVGPETVQLAGQAESAAPLLGLLDSSGALTGASFLGSISRNESREVFRIRARRAGSTAP